ncbi:type I-C CRISPR-associated protein Cas8c/Csd1 [Ammoniphilus oxalaticus]|uniref:Type I-C CRISPR-associated protein Cas8c/Csd1 n=1 Tax=Ammoniphilus oxalaticus TaxID=66863 RepID=A0A419SLL5_9BACL|nr:type I-C CRISPR-associated protein Cas8c/Csd1 [Ammoniphilus oxalaticus]RKD24951.1 type I-C CRISPR-associated protein Cas8c/Csd1 [Ammoniphilus oxalaticus]
MSWLLHLYETYESNQDQVGVIEKKRNGQEYTLLPISHTTQNAHIDVNITEDGQFHSATVIAKSDASTLIPCTEDAANRAGSKVAPYPLHDKLSYVAGDYIAYGGNVKNKEHFAEYLKQLEKWTNSPYAMDVVKSIYRYVSKRSLIQDLVNEKILVVDDDGQLLSKWNKDYEDRYGERPAIFSALTGDQEGAFVRFNVRSPDKILTDIWKCAEMYQSFIRYYQAKLGNENEDVCYVTGKRLPSTDKHTNKIRHAADKAKLISANDSSGFTYRGRFSESNEVANVSYEVSQKAHNALKWLINRQAKIVDGRVFLVWGNEQLDLPDLVEDSFDLFGSVSTESKTERSPNTLKEFAREIEKSIDGLRGDLSTTHSSVYILILDSATTGRMAVLYYRYMDKDLYLDRLKAWHTTCVWRHRHRKNSEGKMVSYIGSPSTKDVAFAAYGPLASDKIVKGLMERLVPCIVDGRSLPLDIVRSAVQRASNPVSMDRWEWEKTLSVTCALINKILSDQKGEYDMALDTENNDRDYLFGRLLAVADVLERRALGPSETRSTNAIRYMNSFSRHPERTWKTIQEGLQPYQARLGTKARYLSGLIDEIASRIEITDFNNQPLSGKYLLGFYSQRHELYQKRETDRGVKENEARGGN